MQWPTLQDLRDAFGVQLLWLCREWLVLRRPDGAVELWQRSHGRKRTCTAYGELWALGVRYVVVSRDETTVFARLRERLDSNVAPLAWG